MSNSSKDSVRRSRVPRFLYVLHGRLVERMFDGRGMRPHHTIALALVRRALDFFQMREIQLLCAECAGSGIGYGHYYGVCTACRGRGYR